jgi:hypothetical protein
MSYWDRPCAAHGLTAYRLQGPLGWIMIGATDHADAMREARRSTPAPRLEALEVWNGSRYVRVWPHIAASNPEPRDVFIEEAAECYHRRRTHYATR